MRLVGEGARLPGVLTVRVSVARFSSRRESRLREDAMKSSSTAAVLVGGIAAVLLLGFAISALEPPPAARTEGQEPPVAAGTALEAFVPVDTARLNGSPDEQPNL